MTTPYEEGDPTSKIIILGEAPARTEMRLGRPLVGPAGQLLEQSMHSAGMVRRECYLTNVFDSPVTKSRDGNSIFDDYGGLLWSHKGGITELGLETAAPCIERINKSTANIIIPLGGTALSFAYGDNRIMKWRGSILAGKDMVSNKKLTPTVHPAACLRGQYLWRHLMISDLAKAKERSTTPKLNLPVRNLMIDPIFPEVMKFLSMCRRSSVVATDIEVLNHQVSCISFATSAKDSMCIPFVGDNGQHRWSEQEEDDIWSLIATILADPSIEKIGQNLIFDISFLWGQMNIPTYGHVCDTMIAHHIMYPDFPKGLDFLCSMHTDEPYYKDDGKLWSKPWRDLEAFWLYNAKDSAVAFEIWDEMKVLLERDGYTKTYEDTVDLFPVLIYMMLRGVKVDGARLEETKIAVADKIKEKEAELIEVSDYPFNIASPKQCQEYFYIHKGFKPYLNRKTGRPTTDDKAMSRLFRKGNCPEAKIVQELRALKKLYGTYLEVGIDKDMRIRCSYNPRGATTGRLSSSQTIFRTGMNMQNLHPEFKGFLVADDDR